MPSHPPMSRSARAASITALALASASTASCRSRSFSSTPKSGGAAPASGAACETGVRLADYVTPTKQFCYQSGRVDFDSLKAFNPNVRLAPWVPCNAVELASMASSGYAPSGGSSMSTYDFKEAFSYLTGRKFPLAAMAKAVFADPSKPLAEASGHPVFRSPIHRAIARVVESTQHRVFLDSMLFGGAWGIEVVRLALLRAQEARAAGRPYRIVIMRDTKNNFGFRPESDDIWAELVAQSASGPFAENLVVLEAEIGRRRTSALPLGVDRISSELEGVVKANLALSGTSDHSKIVIGDAYADSASMVVMSKNVTDFNHTNYDEGVFVRGPAASIAMHHFMVDYRLALEKARKAGRLEGAALARARELVALDESATSPGATLRVKGPEGGTALVRAVENNADDSVRNVEHNVLKLIAGARKNVRVYNFLAYHPGVAEALAHADKRLGKGSVRSLLDSSLSYKLNSVFTTLLKQEMLQKIGSESLPPLSEVEAVDIGHSVRWRKLMRDVLQSDKGFLDIKQQQHVKSIIVDDEFLLVGSANFDYNTLKGAFREFSVVVRDPVVAKASAAQFDALWGNPEESVSDAEIAALKGEALPVEAARLAGRAMALELMRNESMDPSNLDLGAGGVAANEACY